MKRVVFALVLAAAANAQPGFKPLFNGKDLKGWDGDPKLWKVAGGAIVGNTEGATLNDNTFLIAKGVFKNFILRADVKLRNHNSGIQFRSDVVPGTQWVVRGYQADMAENNYWGCIYEEKSLTKRGILVNGWKDKAEKVVKLKDWNTYEILCDGDHIQLKLNGTVTADIHDSAKLDGIIALQLHRGPGMEASFKNIKIKKLK
ncbi:MAG: DUF1080 domain-containing protein [Bryobacterales bacterium]|nr:DUF1080 domain-containing protein [Bryobacterales bacterium]